MDFKNTMIVGVVIVILAFLVVSYNKNKSDDTTPKDEEKDKEPPPPTPTPTPTPTGTGTPPPPPPTTPTPTGGTGGSGSQTKGGAASGGSGTSGTDPYTYYDINSEQAKNIINNRIAQYFTNRQSYQEIKKQNQIGIGIWSGISDDTWVYFWQSDYTESPLMSIKRFFADRMADESFDWYKPETFPIYHPLEKPNLKNEMTAIKNMGGGAKSLWFNLGIYNFSSFGGANIFAWFGGHERRHEAPAIDNTITFATNYLAQMERLESALYQAAILSLRQHDMIKFTGLNA